MKKLLIATAAMAMVAGTAQAQSSVTIYGIVDSGIVSANGNNAGRQTTVSAGTLATSRLGFRGTEDLGGGLTANFNLENGFNADTGAAQGGSVLFDRQSWVGLAQKGVGTVQFGRTTRLDFDTVVAGDTFGAANFGGNVGVVWGNINSSNSTVASSRSDNSVKLSSDKFAGFSVAYQHGFGEQAGDNAKQRFTAYQADYTAGKARLTYAGSRTNDANGAKNYETTLITGSYDFGVAKLFAGYGEREEASKTSDVKIQYVGATAPVSAKVNVLAQYTKVDNKLGVAADDADAYAVGALYAFSKRTTGYLLAGRVNNDGASNQGIAAAAVVGGPSAGKDQTAYAFGIRHVF